MNTPARKTPVRRTSAQWQHLITDFEAGQDTVNVFCKKNNLNPSSFYLWKSKLTSSSLKKKTNPPLFVPIKTRSEKTTSEIQWHVELKLGSRMTLRFTKS